MPELPNIVRERLKVSRPTAAHPDADVLTAFAERALRESERAVVAEHLARCHDCRDVLALALPATVIVETARVPLPVRRGWLRAPVLRWGVVAAGLAVFSVIGLMQFKRGRGQRSSVAEIQRYEAPAPEAKAKTTAPAGQAEESAKLDESAKLKLSAPSVLAEPVAAPASASRVHAVPTIADSANAPFKKERAASPPRSETARLVTPSTSNVAGPVPGLPLHGSGSRNAAGGTLGGSIDGSLPLSGKQATPSADKVETHSQLVATNGPDQAPGRAFMDIVDKAKAPSTTIEVSAEAAVLQTETAAPASPVTPFALRWAISASGGLLRSFDQGRTWASLDVNANLPGGNQMAMVAPQSQSYQQSTQDASQLPTQGQIESKTASRDQAVIRQKAKTVAVSTPVFRAVSAAGLEVWAGGSAGMLYHSADGGERWARVVPSSSGIFLTGDILGIAFSDPQHGHITTSTQELWATVDDGLTWQKR